MSKGTEKLRKKRLNKVFEQMKRITDDILCDESVYRRWINENGGVAKIIADTLGVPITTVERAEDTERWAPDSCNNAKNLFTMSEGTVEVYYHGQSMNLVLWKDSGEKVGFTVSSFKAYGISSVVNVILARKNTRSHTSNES